MRARHDPAFLASRMQPIPDTGLAMAFGPALSSLRDGTALPPSGFPSLSQINARAREVSAVEVPETPLTRRLSAEWAEAMGEDA